MTNPRMTAAEIARRREARGMSDPLNRLRAYVAEKVAEGGAIVEVPACVECGDALDSTRVGAVCSACIADASEIGDSRTREQIATAVAQYDR